MNAVPPAPTFPWSRTVLALVLVELALCLLYFSTARAMVEIWLRSATFNHAFLVPPIALWLIWEKRRALAILPPRPAPWLLLPLAGLAAVWLLGELAAVNAVTQFAFVALLVLAVPLLIGLPAARRIAFPLGFLFFAVPVGEFVMPKLMEWTAMFTVLGLRASGIPVYQEGLHFVIPSGRWSVVEACSGVRYLIASLVVGTLYAYLTYRSFRRRMIFVGFSILVPLVANWLRAYMIVMLGHLSNNRIATGVDHLIYGWVFFGVVMLILFAIGQRWREDPATETAASVSAGAPVDWGRSATNVWLPALLALAIAVAPSAWLARLNDAAPLPAPEVDLAVLATDGWLPVPDSAPDWRPAFANPTAEAALLFERAEQRVGVHVAFYRQQDYGRKIISSENVLVKSSDPAWAQVGRGTQTATLGDLPVTVRSGSLRSQALGYGAEPLRLRVWHWYWIDGTIVTNDYLGKLRLALARLAGRGDASAAIFVYALEPEAERTLADFLSGAGRGLTAVLEHAAVTGTGAK